ncbi:hypothetical protein DSM106972_044320 [Dulcicalothrix desertica PCC 7102]|uniref:Polyketide synthase n=1 Tax=Dulcicalothrix desertica PCC 7102 TaxID=232991 RepID=A0A3S1D620_9CYAN|nr:type I polyketide synthase [Dulcicalothrix desertica]RUT04204.1 hypothetical protein DSM106972_044320 [Dulcicalothrix desertica PCC 7102]TWH44212.1 acyl transferase domain-containing protein [Dulcicalothrix desertica PCC 7102]TWH51490.1 acyl transferase domain-containing protein [Dulcicalothrix desertica PCC 7102]
MKMHEEAIAIVGIGCRFPGAKNPQAFWQLLCNGIDAISEVPASRWNIEAFYDPDPTKAGKMNTRWGGFLEQLEQFDSQFFGIAPREALSMDPQQRLLLEVTWEALEDAALIPESLSGSPTGVFVGISNYDYYEHLIRSSVDLDAYAIIGNNNCIAANRISYLFNFTGPSIAVDTACSSSLVAVHLACQSIWNRESSLAIASGVNIVLSPWVTASFSQGGFMAADGRCKTFDAGADGYVRSEGAGVVVLKPLSQAVADGNLIYAVIRGSAVNQDGHSNGLTAPNPQAQQAVLREAYRQANVSPSQIQYIEAHGTGTSLGDPMEMKALTKVLSVNRKDGSYCAVGSVKTNIGHLEAAAGIAGLIKVALSLKHRKIPPSLHFLKSNPYIPFDKICLRVQQKLEAWPESDFPALAGVSSFGYGGTNAHIVLEEAPLELENSKAKNQNQELIERPLHLLALSAKSENALRSLAKSYEEFLIHSTASVADVCFATNTGRTHFESRLAVVADSNIQLRERLLAFADGRETTGIVSGLVNANKHPEVAFLFTGQGSQYVDMGRQLYESQPIFRQTLDLCDMVLRPYLGTSLLGILYPKTQSSDSKLDETAYTQPALFAIEYALVQLWQSWGIKPDVVLGHSVGEYVAACVAGVFSLEDALKLIAYRGKLIQELPPTGEMVAVMASSNLIHSLIAGYGQQVAIAAFNGPSSTVISGSTPAIRAICELLSDKEIKFKKLDVSHAFHSPLMQPMLADFEVIANQVTYNQPKIPLISNVTGQRADDTICTPEYWLNHILQPVRFVDSITCLNQLGYKIYLEIGSKPILLGMARQCLLEDVGVWLPSLRSPQTDWQQILESLGVLYINGVSVDWKGFEKDYTHQKVALPTYPFERQRYWLPETAVNESLSKKEVNQTSIINLLHQGDIQKLTERLAAEFDESRRRDLPQLLSVLVKCHQQEINSTLIKDWFYKVEWQLKQRYQNKHSNYVREIGTWLILCDEGNLGTSLAQTLQQQGNNCLLVYPGEFYQRLNTNWSVNPSHLEDFERLLHEALIPNQQPLQGVIHLWSLNVTPTQEVTLSGLEQAQKGICGSILHLVQALLKCNKSPALWIVTRGAIAIDSTPPNVVQAPVWGVGGVIALEHSELWGGMLDLAPEPYDDEAVEILAEIADSQGEDHIALRSRRRYVARVVPKNIDLTNPTTSLVANKKDVTYLITGGLGALGLKIAEWMVEQGATHLVLIGRSGASTQAQQAIAKMEQTGVRVLVAQADVCKQSNLVKVLQEIKAAMPPLGGIVHAAGVVGYQPITSMKWSDFESVTRPKLLGGWNLHQLTRDIELDFFVSLSSIASVWGSKGQAHYAAANYFLDTLADYRQCLGLPSLSVNWGPWAEVGMAVGKAEQFLSRLGIKAMQPNLALTALEIAIKGASARATIVDVDWRVFKDIYEVRGKRALLEKIAVTAVTIEENIEVNDKRKSFLCEWKKIDQLLEVSQSKFLQHKDEFFQRLQETPINERQTLLATHIRSQVAKVLGFSSTEQVDLHQHLNNMGLDSLVAIELRNWVQACFDVEIPVVKFMENLNIIDIAIYINEQITKIKSTLEESIQVTTSNFNNIIEGEL